jgi:uncharacterized Ntn-hydrolase superfamily protein
VVAFTALLPTHTSLCAVALLLLSGPSWATYSIVATDSATAQVGGAGTSCLGGSDVYRIYGSAPGYGAVQAQAQASVTGRNQSVLLLGEGSSPDEIIAFITASDFDSNAASRQYGVVDLQGRASGFTGGNTLSFAADLQGGSGSFTYSVQGNILTSSLVLEHAVTAFESAGCDLAERLLLALEAGGSAGEGDSRCTDSGIPSDSAFLQVDLPLEPAGSYLELRVPSSGNDNPLSLLRSQFDEWRLDHPCPLDVDAGANEESADAGSVIDGGNLEPDGSASSAAGGIAAGGQGTAGRRDAGSGGTQPAVPAVPTVVAAGGRAAEAPAPSTSSPAPAEAVPGPGAVVPPASSVAPLLAPEPSAPSPSASPSTSASSSDSSSDDSCKCALRPEPASPLAASSLLLGLLLFARRRSRLLCH